MAVSVKTPTLQRPQADLNSPHFLLACMDLPFRNFSPHQAEAALRKEIRRRSFRELESLVMRYASEHRRNSKSYNQLCEHILSEFRRRLASPS